jgi:drug/metabolite transporter (DMT)-like permease
MQNLGMTALVPPLRFLAAEFRPIRAAHWDKDIALGGIGAGLGAVLLVLAQARTAAVKVAIVALTMPVVGVMFAQSRRGDA